MKASGKDDRSQTAVDVLEKHSDVKLLLPADDVFLPGTEQIPERVKPMLKLIADQAREVMSEKDLALEVRVSEESPCGPSYIINGQCDYWKLTSYQAIALSQFFRENGVASNKIIPIGRGTTPPSYVRETKQDKKRLSTVEFIYQSKSMKIK